MGDKKETYTFEKPSKSQVADAELQQYLMKAQLRKVGEKLKEAVKMEKEDDPEDEALGWSMEVEEEPDPDAEEDMYDEEIEEEEPAHDAHAHDNHDKWTSEDWRQVKAMASDEVVDVDEWAKTNPSAHSSTSKTWAIKAPWAAKRKAAYPMRTDAWGGVSWSDGWYKDGSGTWWPYLSNNLA